MQHCNQSSKYTNFTILTKHTRKKYTKKDKQTQFSYLIIAMFILRSCIGDP